MSCDVLPILSPEEKFGRFVLSARLELGIVARVSVELSLILIGVSLGFALGSCGYAIELVSNRQNFSFL